METEYWRDISEIGDKYQASSLGRIRNATTGKILRPWIAGSVGYEYVALGRARRSTVHRLVCLAFHGEPPTRTMDTAHGDGDHLNNRPENLRWATRSENIADSIRHGTTKLIQYRTDGYKPRKRSTFLKGVDAPSAKLDPSKATEIRRRYSAGETMRSLATAYDVGSSTICRVVNDKVWT